MAGNNTVGIVGKGIIGSSWALVFARAGRRVRIWERGGSKGATPLRKIHASRAALLGTGLEGDADMLARISTHENLDEALRDVDFVQESVPEDIAVKHDILRRIEAAVSPKAIIASSTSGIVPSRLVEV